MSQNQNVLHLLRSLLQYAIRYEELPKYSGADDGGCRDAIQKAEAFLEAVPEGPTDLKEQVMDAIGETLGDAYDCLRVWSAWGVGTMSQDDFARVADDRNRLAELADAAISAMTPKLSLDLLANPLPPQPATKLLEETDCYLREIRAENLDGSEPALGQLLDRVTSFWVAQNQEGAPAEPATGEKPTSTATYEIVVHVSKDFQPDEGDAFDAVISALEFAEIPTVVVQRKVPHGVEPAQAFMVELLNSVETLGGIADAHGARTLADLMYLQQAILTGSFIDHYPDESAVLAIVQLLPSGPQWAGFIKVDAGADALHGKVGA